MKLVADVYFAVSDEERSLFVVYYFIIKRARVKAVILLKGTYAGWLLFVRFFAVFYS